MKIFTPCWGAKHIELFSKSLALSLSWPKNRLAIAGSEWTFVCDNEAEAVEIREIVKAYEFDVTVRPLIVKGLAQSNPDQSLILPLVQMIRECIGSRSNMFMATPDFIFSDGALDAFKIVGSEYGTCVSIAHMRVLPEVLDNIHIHTDFINHPTNAQLMGLGFKYPHPSWVHANASLKENCSYAGGVRWWDLGNKTVAVQHYLTSPFYVSFLESDLEVFFGRDTSGHAKFNLWDHVWPNSLFKYGRFRYIGSSDACLMLEVTEKDLNMPPLSEVSGCSKNSVHNQIQKQFISIFRGE